MQTHQSFGELKAIARKSLEGNYGRAISVLINVQILSFIPTYIILLFFSGNSIFHAIGSEIVGIILSAFLQVLQMGVCFFYLKLNCNQSASTVDLFYGFRNMRNAALGIGVIYTLISYLCILPATLCSYLSDDIMLSYLLLLLGSALEYLVIPPFIQSYYILLDFPGYTAKQAITLSVRIMKGNYFRYLLFRISFLPLILISFLCCGLGLLWVLPYVDASLAAFYLDLMRNYKAKETI